MKFDFTIGLDSPAPPASLGPPFPGAPRFQANPSAPSPPASPFAPPGPLGPAGPAFPSAQFVIVYCLGIILSQKRSLKPFPTLTMRI